MEFLGNFPLSAWIYSCNVFFWISLLYPYHFSNYLWLFSIFKNFLWHWKNEEISEEFWKIFLPGWKCFSDLQKVPWNFSEIFSDFLQILGHRCEMMKFFPKNFLQFFWISPWKFVKFYSFSKISKTIQNRNKFINILLDFEELMNLLKPKKVQVT